MEGLPGMWLNLKRLWMRYRVIFKVLFFAVLCLGIYLGVNPTPPPTSASWHGDFYHAGGLFACTILSFLAYPRWRWWLRGALMFLVGLAIEGVQVFHSTRSAELIDLQVNTGGLAAGLLVIFLFQWAYRAQTARSLR
ncbi:hypothetical protein [Halopseudomonas pelagia]|uniref:hypothetical protein n=1 Tax=Halopseudomonas pelagia TaxID=553151 RepID=UPI0030DB19A7|tara:strand:- start:5267 stop:5677 length:411 start_codon:yes stop_codon:yes gene_type:complete